MALVGLSNMRVWLLGSYVGEDKGSSREDGHLQIAAM